MNQKISHMGVQTFQQVWFPGPRYPGFIRCLTGATGGPRLPEFSRVLLLRPQRVRMELVVNTHQVLHLIDIIGVFQPRQPAAQPWAGKIVKVGIWPTVGVNRRIPDYRRPSILTFDGNLETNGRRAAQLPCNQPLQHETRKTPGGHWSGNQGSERVHYPLAQRYFTGRLGVNSARVLIIV